MNFLTTVATDVVNTVTESTGFPGIDGVLKALPYMGYGMVGIFLITGVIILTVSLLNRSGSKK